MDSDFWSMGSTTGALSGICFDLAKAKIRRPYLYCELAAVWVSMH